MSLIKAKVQIEGQKPLECQFNPGEVSLSKANNWSYKAAAESGSGDKSPGSTTFGGGQAASLKVDLFFDTTEDGSDVRDKIQGLLNAMKAIKGGRPPCCWFIWGNFRSFKAVIKSIGQKYTLFLPDGTPVRATLNLDLQQYQDEKLFPPQNPTSRTSARKTRIVLPGETLDWIAYQEYGHPAMWRFIAHSNGLVNPRQLRPGQVLLLAEAPPVTEGGQ
jgi:nucleoid-associated protein YgaU